MTLMNTSQKGLDLIKKYEGCRLYAYRCPAGVLTIGYGHTNGVKAGQAITQVQAEQFLREDISPIEKLLNGMGVNFKQQQFDALVSWIFNLGAANFKSSTMYKKIIARASDSEITDQLVKWFNAGGKPLSGLKKRRVEEANMFLGRDAYYINNNGDIKRQ